MSACRRSSPELPLFLTLTGIAYNMLKAVDAVYFVHYTGERVPLITYANYMLFFPVITAGPILRYRDFSASLYEQPAADHGRKGDGEFQAARTRLLQKSGRHVAGERPCSRASRLPHRIPGGRWRPAW